MAQPYTHLVFVKDGKVMGDAPAPAEVEKTVLWKDALWEAAGSLGGPDGRFEYKYTFLKRVPKEVE